MNRFLPGRKLSFAEIKLIPEAVYQLFVARYKVSYLPSGKWMPKSSPEPFIQVTPEMQAKALLVASVINGLATRTPWKSTCLVKALAAHRMLKKRGIAHQIHFGVAKTPSKSFEAHAWLSVDGRVLIGGGNLNDFHEIGCFG